MTIPVFLDKLREILDSLIPLIIGLGVFTILWGLFGYITHAAEEEKRAEARLFIVWGLLGVFFMLSIWGFVHILDSTFSLNKQIRPEQIPQVPVFHP